MFERFYRRMNITNITVFRGSMGKQRAGSVSTHNLYATFSPSLRGARLFRCPRLMGIYLRMEPAPALAVRIPGVPDMLFLLGSLEKPILRTDTGGDAEIEMDDAVPIRPDPRSIVGQLQGRFDHGSASDTLPGELIMQAGPQFPGQGEIERSRGRVPGLARQDVDYDPAVRPFGEQFQIGVQAPLRGHVGQDASQ